MNFEVVAIYLKKTAILIMLITVLSKILGLLRDIILSYFYGASNISDAYLVSLIIPGVIFSFIGIAINTGYIPMYSNIIKRYGEKEAVNYTNNLVNLLILLCTAVAILILLFTDPIVKIFASGFSEDTINITVSFTKIMVFSIYFTSLVHVFSGYLQLKNNYIIPALIGFPLNLFFIISIILSSKINIIVLAIGSTIAYLAQFLLLIPFVKKEGYNYKPHIDLNNDYIKKMIYLGLPVIVGTSVNQINILVDSTLASQQAVGGVSALNYANKLNLFVQGIFVMSIATVIFPIMSKMFANENKDAFKKTIKESIISVILLVIPAIIGFMIFSSQIVTLLFGRGAFDSEAIKLTSSAVFFYSIGMIGFGLREILARAFYSMQDTKTPMINATMGVIVNIILNIILAQYMGIGGLALATSISAILTSILLFINLRKKIGPFGLKDISRSLIKIVFASLIMGVVAKISFKYFETILSQNFSLLIAIIIGGSFYLIIIYFMKIDDVEGMVKIIKNKIQKKSNKNG